METELEQEEAIAENEQMDEMNETTTVPDEEEVDYF